MNTAQTDYSLQISRRVVFHNDTNVTDDSLLYRHNRDPDVVTWNTTTTLYKFYSSNLTLHVQNFSIPDPGNVRAVKYICLFRVALESQGKAVVNRSITAVINGFSKL